MKTTLALGIVASVLAAGVWSIGCSSSSGGGGGTADDGGATDGSSVVKKDGGGTGSDAGTMGGDDSGSTSDSGSTGGDQACSANGADADSCGNCCFMNHMEGEKTFDTALINCECGTNGPCKTACANTVCAAQPMPADQACDTCIKNDLTPDAGTACLQQVVNACKADPDCVAEQKCFGTCP